VYLVEICTEIMLCHVMHACCFGILVYRFKSDIACSFMYMLRHNLDSYFVVIFRIEKGEIRGETSE